MGSDRWRYSPSRLEAKANERPAQLKRRSNTAIRLNIEMRCARRQNDAAYQHYRRRSVSGRHAIIIHRRQVQHQSSRGMFLTLWMARMPLGHRPIVLRSPVNGSESAIGRGCIRATGRDAFLLKPLLRVPYVYSAYRTQPKYNILTSTPSEKFSKKSPNLGRLGTIAFRKIWKVLMWFFGKTLVFGFFVGIWYRTRRVRIEGLQNYHEPLGNVI